MRLWPHALLALVPLVGLTAGLSPAAPPPPDIHGFRSWHRATKELYSLSALMAMVCSSRRFRIDGPHWGYGVHVYVNSVGKPAMCSERTVFPVGSVIVKEKHRSGDQKAVLLTAMRKRASGFDAKNGDWEYFVGDPKTMKLTSPDAKTLKTCQSCHALYKDRDFVTKTYLIGGLREPLREEVNRPPRH